MCAMGADGSWVAVRVARLAAPAMCAHPRSAMVDPTLRAALLTDLALTGALVTTDNGPQIDSSPTGFPPADRLLAAVASSPGKSLAWWLYHAPVTARDLAETLVHSTLWEARGHGRLRRYRDVTPQQRSAELQQLDAELRRPSASPPSAATASFLALLPISDLPRRVRSGGRGPDCGPARWLVDELLDNLTRWQDILSKSNSAAISASLLNYA